MFSLRHFLLTALAALLVAELAQAQNCRGITEDQCDDYCEKEHGSGCEFKQSWVAALALRM